MSKNPNERWKILILLSSVFCHRFIRAFVCHITARGGVFFQWRWVTLVYLGSESEVKCAVLRLLPNTGSNSLRCNYNVNVTSLVWFCLCWTRFLPDVWKSRNQICINGLVLVWFLNSCTCSNSLTCNFSTLTHLSSSTSHRLPPASPSTHSIAGASGTSSSSSTPSSRLSRGSTVRSTFHGGQIRDRRPPSHAPPASPTLSHDASPLPHARTRGTTNLLSKITSKLTRR